MKITISKLPNPMSYVETQNVEQTFSKYYQALFLAGAEDAEGDVSYEIIREKSDDEIVDYCTLDGRKLTVDADAPGGTYTLVIRAKAEGNDIYASAEKESIVTLQLNKAYPSKKNPEARTLKYNGQAQELVTAGKAAGGDMVYALGKDDTNPPSADKWSESIPKGTEAGTYYVWFKVRGDNKHFDSEPECIVVKIAEADPPPIVESIITFDLNGGSLDGKTGIVTLKEKNGTVITLPAPIRDGYTFDYWEGSKYYAGDQYTVNGDHTLKAVWKTATNGSSNSDGKNSSNKSAETGDENALGTWIVLLIAALTGTTGMVFARKIRNG